MVDLVHSTFSWNWPARSRLVKTKTPTAMACRMIGSRFRSQLPDRRIHHVQRTRQWELLCAIVSTVAGAILVDRSRPNRLDSLQTDLKSIRPYTMFLVADDGSHGRELWKSNGTTEGTVLVRRTSGPVAMGRVPNI